MNVFINESVFFRDGEAWMIVFSAPFFHPVKQCHAALPLVPARLVERRCPNKLAAPGSSNTVKP